MTGDWEECPHCRTSQQTDATKSRLRETSLEPGSVCCTSHTFFWTRRQHTNQEGPGSWQEGTWSVRESELNDPESVPIMLAETSAASCS